jgi:hypothetical protein
MPFFSPKNSFDNYKLLQQKLILLKRQFLAFDKLLGKSEIIEEIQSQYPNDGHAFDEYMKNHIHDTHLDTAMEGIIASINDKVSSLAVRDSILSLFYKDFSVGNSP